MSGINRSKDPLRGHGFKGLNAQGPRVEGFQGLNGFKDSKGPRALGFKG